MKKIIPLLKALKYLGVLVAGLAYSQVGYSAALEEIIVTAEKRTQNTQDVPLAVTTISGDRLTASGITSLGDVALKTPNLSFTEFNIGEPQLFLRGLGSTADSAGADPTVSLFIDEVYIGRSGSGSADLFDLDRIEILRGPQGTLYGRNVTGGAISMYTKKPTEEFSAKASITLGNYDLKTIRGAVNGAITESVNGKLTFSSRSTSGYSKNITTDQELDDVNNFSIRGQLLFNPSDTTEVLLSSDYSKDNPNGECRDIAKLDRDSVKGTSEQHAYLMQMIIDEGIDDPRKCGQSLIQSSNKTVSGVSMRVEYDFDALQLTSVTAYREAEYDWVHELGGVDAPPGLLGVVDNEGEKSDQLSQEFRLSNTADNMHWVVGVYGIQENIDRFANVPITFASGLLLDRSWLQDAQNTSKAVFGQIVFPVMDKLNLTLGGRQTWDDKEMDQQYKSSPTAVVYDLKGLNDKWDAFTGRVTLDYTVDDDKMLYATWSEGYKSGMFLSQSTAEVGAAGTLNPELATNIEVGMRTEWLDNTVRLNVTYFDMEVSDLQLFRLVNLTLVSENATIESSGAEVEFAFAVTDNFSVAGSYSTLDAKFVGGTFDGNSVTRSPDNKYNIEAEYISALGNDGELRIRAGASHSDNFYTEATNEDVSLHDSYTKIDASAKYTDPTGTYTLEIWGKNLTDELIVRHAIVGSYGGSVELYAPPRTFGVTLSTQF